MPIQRAGGSRASFSTALDGYHKSNSDTPHEGRDPRLGIRNAGGERPDMATGLKTMTR